MGKLSVILPEREAEAACARRLVATSLACYGLLVNAFRRVRENRFDVLIEERPDLTGPECARRLASARSEAQSRAAAYRLEKFGFA
jgi:hypothetical protein